MIFEPSEAEQKYFNTLDGEYRHYCPEWDFMPIDETSAEFEACLCFKGCPSGQCDIK